MNPMKWLWQRLRYNWSLVRVAYLVLGVAITGQSIALHEWFGVLFGSWFLAAGIFAWGCASGNCAAGDCSVQTSPNEGSGGREPQS